MPIPTWCWPRIPNNGSTGSYQWSRVGGATNLDLGYGVALSGQQVYAAGHVSSSDAAFGSLLVSNPAYSELAVLVRLTDTGPSLAARPASAIGPALYPNPAPHGATRLTGGAPGGTVQMFDALSR